MACICDYGFSDCSYGTVGLCKFFNDNYQDKFNLAVKHVAYLLSHRYS